MRKADDTTPMVTKEEIENIKNATDRLRAEKRKKPRRQVDWLLWGSLTLLALIILLGLLHASC